MRKFLWIAAALAIVIAAILWWSSGGSATSEAGAAAGDTTASAMRRSPPSADELEWQHPTATAEELATPGGTPALKRPATDADGHLEISVTAGGKPFPSAHVRVYLRGPRDISTGEIQWRFAGGGATGPDGKLKMAARVGSYLIAVRAEGFATAHKEAARAGSEELTRVELVLDQGLSLRGRVVEKGSGAEVPLAQLTLVPAGLTAQFRATAPAEERVYASADPRGHFELTGLSRGGYRLDARAAGRGKGWAPITLPRSTEVVIELAAASFIQGHVVRSDSKPAPGAEVTVSGLGEPAVAVAGPQGDFSAEVNPGVHHVSARAGAETGSLAEPVSVAPGGTRDVVVQLGKPAAITGTVIDKRSHAPIEGAAIGLSPFNEDGDSGRATSGPDGRFSIEPLAPGGYDLGVAADGYTGEVKKGITVVAGQRFSLTLELDGTGSVEGTVRDSAGAPIAGAVVKGGQVWGGAFRDATAQVRTGGDGHYRIGGLDLGKVRLTAGRRPGEWLASSVVQIREGETAHLDFTLPEPGTVEGRVTYDGGKPLDRTAEVRAFPRTNLFSAADIRPAEPGPDGRYRLELAPGPYSLMASFPAASGSGPPLRANAAVNVESGRTVEQDLDIQPEGKDLALSGEVLEPDGTPSIGALVFFASAARPGLIVPADTGGDGRFTLEKSVGFASPVYALHARNGGRTGELQSVPSGTRDAVVRLHAGGTVLGHFVGAGAKGESYQVDVEVLDQGYPAWSSGPGQQFAGDTFELHDVPALAIRVKVTTPDGRNGSATTTVTSGGRAEVSVALEASATISGRAVGPDHAPVPSALAILDQTVFSTPTGNDGRFSLENVSAGSRKLAITAAALRAQEQELTLTPGQRLELGDVVLDPIRADPGTIGASFTDDGQEVSVSGTLKDGPADRAGVLRGDRLVAVDGQPVHTSQEAKTRTSGAPGTPVKLLLERAGKRLELDVLRAR